MSSKHSVLIAGASTGIGASTPIALPSAGVILYW